MSQPRWHKLGCIYTPADKPRHPKLLTHVANPLAVHLAGDVYRVFYSGRDAHKRSSVGAVDIDIVTRHIVADHETPFCQHGEAGSYDADGMSIGNVYESGGQRYMLYMAWQTGRSGMWRGEVGRLLVHPDATLSRESAEPFMRRDAYDPVSMSYPWVHQVRADFYQMWYGSTYTWNAGNGEMIHVINYASSSDGHVWHRGGLAVPYAVNVAQAFSRPTVCVDAHGYHMWFSYRSGTGERYRIGYAHSDDGVTWRLDLARSGIDVSVTGWDADMIEYPYVFNHNGVRYMLYNGNGYGANGFGLAYWE
ncbi:MAG: hypothetical protein RL076_260 [Chloroflexota bacterium]|jgi:hypothetical protein